MLTPFDTLFLRSKINNHLSSSVRLGSFISCKQMKIEYFIIANFVSTGPIPWQFFVREYFTVIQPYRGPTKPFQQVAKGKKSIGSRGFFCCSNTTYDIIRVICKQRSFKGGENLEVIIKDSNKPGQPSRAGSYAIGLVQCKVGITNKYASKIFKVFTQLLLPETKCENIEDGGIRVLIKLPDITDSTSIGTIVANYYYLEIRDQGLLRSRVVLSIPIFIKANKPNFKIPKTIIPYSKSKDWSPQVHQTCCEGNVAAVDCIPSSYFECNNRPAVVTI